MERDLCFEPENLRQLRSYCRAEIDEIVKHSDSYEQWSVIEGRTIKQICGYDAQRGTQAMLQGKTATQFFHTLHDSWTMQRCMHAKVSKPHRRTSEESV